MAMNPPDQVDVWVLDCAGFKLDELEQQGLMRLDAQERARYERYELIRSRRQLLLSRAMLRTVLTRYLGADVAIRIAEHGRPELVQASPLSFNLSHSRDRVIVAVSSAGPVGVDVEYAARPRRVERLMTRYFSDLEQAALLTLPPEERLARFYRLWALKESYIKARGLGLAIPLGDFSFEFLDPEERGITIHFSRSQAAQSAEHWSFWSDQIAGKDYAFGLALNTDMKGVRVSVRHACAESGIECWDEPEIL